MDKAIGKSMHFSPLYHLFLIILKYNRRGCKKTMNYPAAPLCGIYALLGRSLWLSPIRSDKLRGIKPYRFRIVLQMIRVIRVICEICGLKFNCLTGKRKELQGQKRDIYCSRVRALYGLCGISSLYFTKGMVLNEIVQLGNLGWC